MTLSCRGSERSWRGQKGRLGVGGKLVNLLSRSLTYVSSENITRNAGKTDRVFLGWTFASLS